MSTLPGFPTSNEVEIDVVSAPCTCTYRPAMSHDHSTPLKGCQCRWRTVQPLKARGTSTSRAQAAWACTRMATPPTPGYCTGGPPADTSPRWTRAPTPSLSPSRTPTPTPTSTTPATGPSAYPECHRRSCKRRRLPATSTRRRRRLTCRWSRCGLPRLRPSRRPDRLWWCRATPPSSRSACPPTRCPHRPRSSRRSTPWPPRRPKCSRRSTPWPPRWSKPRLRWWPRSRPWWLRWWLTPPTWSPGSLRWPLLWSLTRRRL